MTEKNKQEIVRTKTRISGGLTEEEKVKMKAHADMWIGRILRTEPIDPEKITPAIKGLYRVAGLKEPRVIVVSSPMAMAFAYGAATALIEKAKAEEKKTSKASKKKA